MQKLSLNAGQTAAAEGFFKFLFSDQPELIISGAGGVGKTHLMGHLIDQVLPQYFNTCTVTGVKPEYDTVQMTATTNKAAEVLGEATGRPTATIHSFLGLRVKEDFSSGKTSLMRTTSWKVHSRLILFIDEAFTIETALLKLIREGTINCKVVYVGDHSQLPPVFEEVSPLVKAKIPMFTLTEPMRSTIPALHAVCAQLRETVRTGIFLPIKTVPGVIDWLDSDDVLDHVKNTFTSQQNNSRVLAYSNAQVNALNSYIRDLRGLPKELQVGDELISNSALQLATGMVSVEEPVKIVRADGFDTIRKICGAELSVRMMDLETPYKLHTDVPVPTDKFHFESLLKHFARCKEWVTYFELKNNYPDLRPREASTVHKSQGSSYNSVYIDMDNLSSCRQPKLAARLLYVAFTRARKHIIMYGNLDIKYGGIIE